MGSRTLVLAHLRMLGRRVARMTDCSWRSRTERDDASRGSADVEFQRLAATSDVLIFGHTHKPYTKRVDNVLFVNAGSIGKPKDGDPRASYVMMNTYGDVDVEFRRIPYGVEKAANAIRESSLADKFADDIERGGAPAPAPAASS